jgi:hypothetical protein
MKSSEIYHLLVDKTAIRLINLADSQTKRSPPISEKLSRTTLAVLAIGVLSCALFSQRARAQAIEGNINFAGGVQFDTISLATATRVVT